MFQSTRPRGGATLQNILTIKLGSFNPRARGGGATKCPGNSINWLCFNPRARGGARHLDGFFQDDRAVSIHAPAGGRDPISSLPISVSVVSIHAPAGGRDFDRVATESRDCCFNPRARGGARLQGLAALHDVQVSIHAPAGGRDFCSCIDNHRFNVSIHAPAGGRDQIMHPLYAVLNVSIHAPAGGRDNKMPSFIRQVVFQSTRPRGGATRYLTTASLIC